MGPKIFTFLNLNNVRKIISYLHYLLFVTLIICLHPFSISGSTPPSNHRIFSKSICYKTESSPTKMIQESTVNYFLPNNLTDSLALVDLYNATDGANWTNNTGWLTDPILSNWYGVGINGDGRVVSINLTNNNLIGIIPASIGNISNLMELWLNENQLTGSIPSSIGNLTHLITLWLNENQLTASFPSFLQNLTALQNLGLAYNQITGPIPAFIGSLIHLQYLDFFGLPLGGNIPTELGNLTELVSLGLSACQLTGSIPTSLGNLVSLQTLILQGNNLTGCFPSSLHSLCNHLTYYNLSGNISLPGGGDFSSFCADSTGKCTPCDNSHPDYAALVDLYNSTNGNTWANNTGWLVNCNVCTWNGVHCDENNRVYYLYLPNNNLSGTLPSSIGNFSSLKYLYLGGVSSTQNHISGIIPASIGNLSNLEVLELGGNQFSGSIPSSISNLSNLTELGLNINQLTGNIPSGIGNLLNLENLSFSENQLSGTIPTSLFNLSHLTWLALNNNQLIGSIPSGIGNLSNLQYLALSDNQLSGSIPSSIGNLSNLFQLEFQNNLLTGCFPHSLHSLCNIYYDFTGNVGLPGGGDFDAFCSNNAGECNSCPSPLAPTFSLIQPTCTIATGTITVVKNTTSDSVSFNDGITYQFSNFKSGLALGNYSLKLKSIAGCISNSINATLNSPTLGVTINNLDTVYSKSDPIITLTGTPGGGTFYIDNIKLALNSFSPILLTVGYHTVLYKVIQGNCTISVSKQFRVKQANIPSDPGDCFNIQNYTLFGSGKVAGLQGNTVVQQTSMATSTQTWVLESFNGYKRFKNKTSGLYLRVSNGNLVQASYTSPASDWSISTNTFIGASNIISRSNHKYLTASKTNSSYSLSSQNLLGLQFFKFTPSNCSESQPLIIIPNNLTSNLAFKSSKALLSTDIEIYPNPNTGRFTLQVNDLDSQAESLLTIYDPFGRKVWSKKLAGNDQNTKINLDLSGQQISTGLYLIQLKSGNTFTEKKFIIQK